MIIILQSILQRSIETGQPMSRIVTIYISSGSEAYMDTIGDLPLSGSLQAILDANEAQHFADAKKKGILPTLKEEGTAEAIIWFNANPSSKNIFNLSGAALEAQVDTLVEALYRGIPAATLTDLKKLWTAQLMAIRASVRGELEDLGGPGPAPGA